MLLRENSGRSIGETIGINLRKKHGNGVVISLIPKDVQRYTIPGTAFPLQ